MANYYPYPIYAKESKDIPDWMKGSQSWQNAVAVDKLQKHQMKVRMSCAKCEEKVVEEIREVHGVFDVKSERLKSKVIIVAMPLPNGLNEHEVLKRARKVDKKAKFVDLDASEKPKTEEQKKKEAEEAKKKKEAEDKKKKDEEEKKKHEAALANMYGWKASMVPVHWPGANGSVYYAPQPEGYYPGEYFREFMMRQKEAEEKKKKDDEEKKKKEKEKDDEEKKKKEKEKDDEEKKKKEKEKEAEDKKKKEQELAASIPFLWNPSGSQWGGPAYFPPQPFPYSPEELREYRPSQWYAPRYQYPPLPTFQPERDEFSRPYFYYK